LVIFDRRSRFIFRSAWSMIFLIYASYIGRMTGLCHHSQLFLLRWDLRSFLPGLAWKCDPPNLSFPSSWDDRHCQADGVSQTFCLGLPQIIILLISSSWVARITGLSHWHPARVPF
jgi:hypothetical protein